MFITQLEITRDSSGDKYLTLKHKDDILMYMKVNNVYFKTTKSRIDVLIVCDGQKYDNRSEKDARYSFYIKNIEYIKCENVQDDIVA